MGFFLCVHGVLCVEGFSEALSAVQQQRHGTVVHERHLHHRLKLAARHLQSTRLQLPHDVLVERFGDERLSCGVKRGTAALPAVARERELRNDQYAAADILHRSVEMTRRLRRILEDAKVSHLAGDVLDVRRAIALLDSHEHHHAAINLSNRAPIHGDGRARYSLDDGPHALVVDATAGTGPRVGPGRTHGSGGRLLSSAGGLSRVSSRCRGATLPSAFSIDCFTPACSRSSSIRRRLVRWRCKPRAPHAGQQQPMTGSSHSFVYARASSSPTYTSGRMTTCSPLSDTSLAGMALRAPAKSRFSSSVSMKSSAGCPSAIFVAPT